MSDNDQKEFEQARTEIHERLKKYIAKSPYDFNPDEKKVNEILDGLAMKKIKKGRFYCPCRIFTGDESKDRKTICPCIWHRQEKEEKGTCCCEIFVKK